MNIFPKFSSNDGTGYVYTNTRVRVMKSKLLKKDDFERLLKMSLSEIAKFLQETEYKKEFDEFARFFNGMPLVEYSLNKNIENQFSSILKFSVRNARGELNLYLERFDVMNIKTILRGKLSGIDNEFVLNEMIAAGKLSRAFFKELVEKSKTFDDVIENMKGNDYYAIIKKYHDNFPKMEDELDRHYYKKVLKSASKSLKDFVTFEILLKNKAINARTAKHKLEFEPIKNSVRYKHEEFHDSLELRTTLKRKLINEALKMASRFSRDVTPVIGYFMAKENEIYNIRMIIRGKKSNLDEDVVRKQLIVGE